MLSLVHKLKTSSHTIPINGEKAIQPTAFRTVHTKKTDTGLTHTSVEWVLESTATEGKYKEHSFILEVTEDSLEYLEKALAVARERFATPELPVEV